MAQPIHAITMPKWGIEMTEGIITGWRVGVGQRVERGAEILDVETEKIVNAVEAPASGVLRRILTSDGETHSVGALIGVIAEDLTSDSAISQFIESFVAAVVSFDTDGQATPQDKQAGADSRNAPVGDIEPGWEDARVSPIARRVALRLAVDLSEVRGTGRNGRISKEDVEKFAARRTDAMAAVTAVLPMPEAGAGVRRVPISGRRASIARRLVEAKQTIPHFRLDMEVDLAPLLEYKHAFEASASLRITVNDLLMRAAALALMRHPWVNAQLEGDEILQFDTADIAIAVATEAGLITPVLRNANLKSVSVIAAESRELIERARAGTLRREEISGGSFTISNLGMYGVTRFDAIINSPQVAILAVGAAMRRPVVRAGALAIGKVVTLTLSADHRVIDGAAGASFLVTLRNLLEQPAGL